jgi:hypothetical protein
MTIPFDVLKTRMLANPEVKAEYDALAPEFEISAELVKARFARRIIAGRTGCPDGHQSVRHRPAGKRADAPEHEDALALRRGDWQ